MKICYLVEQIGPHERKIVAAHAARHAVEIISVAPGEVPGVRVHSLAGLTSRWPLAAFRKKARRVKELLAATRPDLLHVLFLGTNGWLADVSGFAPLMVDVWGSDLVPRPGARESLRHRWRRRRVLAKAARVKCTNEYLRRIAVKMAPAGAEAKLVVIPVGVDPDHFRPPAAPRPGNRPPTLGMTKSLSRIYGHETALSALALLRREFPAARLESIGDGPERGRLADLARALGVAEAAAFHPALPNEEVPGFLAGIDVLLMPSTTESFGVSAVEAAAMEIPVVASDAGGIPDTVRDGVTGFLAPPGDAAALAERAARLLRDPALRRGMGRAGREMVLREFRWDACVERAEQVYAEIAAGGR